MGIPESNKSNKRSECGENIWNPMYSTLVIVNNVFEQKLLKFKLGLQTKKMCKAMFYSRLQCMDLKGTIDYEVESCIDYTIQYVKHVMKQDTETY